MLKRFSVENFKGFRSKVELDFSKSRDYTFNAPLIQNGIVNKVLLYGRNASGKSNLGFAIMDITMHLTDRPIALANYVNYLNGDSTDTLAHFEYVFLTPKGKEVIYRYTKDGAMRLCSEEIGVDGQTVFQYNFQTQQVINEIPEAQSIVFDGRVMDISAVKYMRNNSPQLDAESPIETIVDFANKMLWFRSLRVNEFMGTNIQPEVISDFILQGGYLADFESYLHRHGVDFRLEPYTAPNGKQSILAKYAIKSFDLFSVVSTGTGSLILLYYWIKKAFRNIRFLFLDEFDAFYHYSLSKTVLEEINHDPSFQSVLTTHNPYLADNAFMRPDCYWILRDGAVKSFADSTNKVIREGHSLEHMLLTDEFGN